MQATVYYEFIPAVLGRYLTPYTGYKAYIRADITDEFSTVAYRGTFLLFEFIILANAFITFLPGKWDTH